MAEAMDSGAVDDGGDKGEAFRKLCSHYRRGCSLVAPCCRKVYPCRLCHNDIELSHEIDRHAVTEVECRRCQTRQPVGNKCSECGLKFGTYFCETCRLFDDDLKGQFHCGDCGLCRVGGRDNFFHCSKCGLCLPHAMKDNHACREAASKDNCPVCFEDIHSSTNSAHIPHCGHLIHTTCYSQLLRKGIYQCPQCQTSLPNMTNHWAKVDRDRDLWVMPKHLKDFNVKVKCRDCHQEGDTAYHVVGLKCLSCGSYNTVRCGNEEMPTDADMEGLLDRVLQERRRRRRRRRRRNHDGETSSSTDYESEEEDNHSNQHRSDSEDREDPGNHSRPRPQDDSGSGHPRSNDTTDEGADPTNQPNEDNSRNYDGDASENDDIDSSNGSSSDCDSDSDYYEAQRSRTYVSFARRGYSLFLRPIEVPVGTEPGALEWWQDTNDSENEQVAPPIHSRPDNSLHHGARGQEEIDGGSGHTTSPPRGERHHRGGAEPRLVPDLEELNSPREVRRRAIAESIVRNMRLWNSDSESFSELSSEEEKSSDSWVTEDEEVMIGVDESELPQEEAELGINEDERDNDNICRDLPTCVANASHSESGVESAESWFTSSDNSHSQIGCNGKYTVDQPAATTRPRLSNDNVICGPALLEEGQPKTERDSVCSSTSTDDSLAWETACEDLMVS